MLAEIERSLATSEAALQGVVTALLEKEAQQRELTAAEVGSMLEELSDTLAGQRKARADMLGRMKQKEGPSAGMQIPAKSPNHSNTARDSLPGDVNWEFRTLQRVRSLMVREVTALEAREPVDTARVSRLKADISKLSNALCELIAQPQGTPSRQSDRVVRHSPGGRPTHTDGNQLADAKPTGPSPTITPPDEPAASGAERSEVAITPQVGVRRNASGGDSATASPSAAPTAWESPLTKLLEMAAAAQASPTDSKFNSVVAKIMRGPTPRKVELHSAPRAISRELGPESAHSERTVVADVSSAAHTTLVAQRAVSPATRKETMEEITVVFESESACVKRTGAAIRIQAAVRGRRQRCRHRHLRHMRVTVSQIATTAASDVDQRLDVPQSSTRRQLAFGMPDGTNLAETTSVGIVSNRRQERQPQTQEQREQEQEQEQAQEQAQAQEQLQQEQMQHEPEPEPESEPEHQEQQAQEHTLEQQQQQLLHEQRALEKQRKAAAAAVANAAEATVLAARASPECRVITLMISVLSHKEEFQKRQKLSGVLGNGTIADVKALIERRSGLKAMAQRLRMDDRSTPPDDASLRSLGLADGSHLELLRPPPRKQSASAPAPSPASAPERTSSGSSSDQSPKPSAFASVAPARATVARTPTRSGRAQQLQATQMMMSPMLSPIRADTIDEVSSPEHGDVAALVQSTTLDAALGTISIGDDVACRPAQQQMTAPVTLTWPSPNGRIARTISEQIDSSPVAQEFEDEMMRHENSGSLRAAIGHGSPAVLVGGDFDRSSEVKGARGTAEEVAALYIQASFRGRQGRVRAQKRKAATCTMDMPQPHEQAHAERPAVDKMLVTGLPKPPNDERIAEPQPEQSHTRATRRQLQFDEPASADAREMPPAVSQLKVAVPQMGDDVDGTSPFSPSPFDGDQISISASDSASLLPSSVVSAARSHGRTISASADMSKQIDVCEGDVSTDSFSPTSAGPTPPKACPIAPLYSHHDAVRAHVACTDSSPDPVGSPKAWVGSLTVADDPRHSSPGENRFKRDQEVKRSVRKARQLAKVEVAPRQTDASDLQADSESVESTHPSAAPASTTAPAQVPVKPHKLSDVIGALWPQWVGQFGLVTGPSSMGIVDATAADLALEPWRGDSDAEDDPNMRCWVWSDALAAERNLKHKRYLPKGPR